MHEASGSSKRDGSGTVAQSANAILGRPCATPTTSSVASTSVFVFSILLYAIHIFLTFVSVCLYWRASNHLYILACVLPLILTIYIYSRASCH
jgi:hypothetical protein